MKSICQIPQRPMDAYQAANLMLGLKSDDLAYNDSRFAAMAVTAMREAGWRFIGYNECGEEVHSPPIMED